MVTASFAASRYAALLLRSTNIRSGGHRCPEYFGRILVDTRSTLFSTLQRTSTDSRQCDESKPECRRCTAYGVFCNYDRKYSDLQVSVERATNIKLPQSPSYWPSKTEQLLNKFQLRTALTVSTGKRLHIYQNEVVELAFSVSTLSQAPASNTEFNGLESMLNACNTDVDTNA